MGPPAVLVPAESPQAHSCPGSPWNWGSATNSHGSSEPQVGGLVCATVGTLSCLDLSSWVTARAEGLVSAGKHRCSSGCKRELSYGTKTPARPGFGTWLQTEVSQRSFVVSKSLLWQSKQRSCLSLSWGCWCSGELQDSHKKWKTKEISDTRGKQEG